VIEERGNPHGFVSWNLCNSDMFVKGNW